MVCYIQYCTIKNDKKKYIHTWAVKAKISLFVSMIDDHFRNNIKIDSSEVMKKIQEVYQIIDLIHL